MSYILLRLGYSNCVKRVTFGILEVSQCEGDLQVLPLVFAEAMESCSFLCVQTWPWYRFMYVLAKEIRFPSKYYQIRYTFPGHCGVYKVQIGKTDHAVL